MAGVAKVHPTSVTTDFEVVGKDITWFEVDYIDDVSASTGPTGIVAEVYNIIQTKAIIVAAGPLVTTTKTVQSFGVESTLSADELSAMEAAIQAGSANAGTTVTAKSLVLA